MALSQFDKARLVRSVQAMIRARMAAERAAGLSTSVASAAARVYQDAANVARGWAGVNASSVNGAIRSAADALRAASAMRTNPGARPTLAQLPTVASLYPGAHRYEYSVYVQTRDQFGNVVDRAVRVTSGTSMTGQEIEDFVRANAIRQPSDYGASRTSLANMGSGAYVSAVEIQTAVRTR